MAHDCPDCGLLCHCGGDIDDICLDDEDSVARCTHCQPGRDSEEDDPEGCCYPPGQCVMPGPHRMSECHTANAVLSGEKQPQKEV